MLSVRNLTTQYHRDGVISAVDDVSFDLGSGQTMGIVGESGSGKSVTARSIVRLIRSPGRIVGGEIYWKDSDVLEMDENQLRALRGGEIGLVFQDARNAFDKTYTIGEQIQEAIESVGSQYGSNPRD
ncbi:MAG: ATP-binding cassette domain-containing protein, partial [Halobacteriaceae archaeon]